MTISPDSRWSGLSDPALPAPLPELVGRHAELTRLRERLCSLGNAAPTVLNGLPGVGKTALLIALAHDEWVRAHFRDGILWAGLGPHAQPHSHFSRWGRLLGISSTEMRTFGSDVDWAMALRQAIGARAMLLLIDDVWRVEDALALKIGGPNCTHVMSTRSPALAAAITVDGATAVEVLSDEDGLVLLRQLAPDRVESLWLRARELVSAVGGLPLALTLIGNSLRRQEESGRGDWRLPAALQQVSSASEPRGAFEYSPYLTSTVRLSLHTIIAVTDQQLSSPVRRALYALSVFPPKPNSFSEEAALLVTGSGVEILDQLADTGLLEMGGPDRYSLHQTITDYAHLRLRDTRAHERFITYIAALLSQHRKDYERLSSEYSNILAALDVAFERESHVSFTRIALAFAPFLLARGLYAPAKTVLSRAYQAAASTGDQQAVATALLYLGEMSWKHGEYEQAEQYLQEGLRIARKICDHEHLCALLANLGSLSWKRGNYQEAEAYLQEGLSLSRALHNWERTCELLQVLGSVERLRGNYQEAEASLQEGLRLCRHIGERELLCPILLNLGVIAQEQGKYEQATLSLQEGLQLARHLQHREWVCGFLNNLGDVASEQGDSKLALACFQEGLELARELQHREWISFLLLNLGLTAEKQTDYLLAEGYFQESLALARQIGIPQIVCHVLYGYGNLRLSQHLSDVAEEHFQEMLLLAPEGGSDFLALAQYGLARVAHSAGRVEVARELGEQSATLLERIGRREGVEVKHWLESMPLKTGSRREQ